MRIIVNVNMAAASLDLVENRLQSIEKSVFGLADKDNVYPKVCLLNAVSKSIHFDTITPFLTVTFTHSLTRSVSL